jgi:hypothetical protein
MEMWVVEVICRVAEGVDFEFGQKILGHFLEEPVDYHAAFNSALAVEDEDYLGVLFIVELLFDDFVAIADVLGGVVEIALDKALEGVEENAVAGFMLERENECGTIPTFCYGLQELVGRM